MFPAPPPIRTARPLPDWSEVHRELRRKSVTLSLLWQEYKETPEGLQYSWFCDQCRAWAGKLDLVMRQDHRAGEKLFVDYAGQTVPVVDRETGGVPQAQVFVAVLGASSGRRRRYPAASGRVGPRGVVGGLSARPWCRDLRAG